MTAQKSRFDIVTVLVTLCLAASFWSMAPAALADEPLLWDTVASHPNMFDPLLDPQGACVALAISNHGELGQLGCGSVNLDYSESGLECSSRLEDMIYLKSGSPFVILADDWSGTNASLTCSYMDADASDPNGWNPTSVAGSLRGGTNELMGYDSVFTGQFVNRDATIAMERTFYAPRSDHPGSDIINFVVCRTMFCSADLANHSHITLGSVIDWNVPSDRPGVNTSGIYGDILFVQGVDTAGSEACQPSTNRYATEVLLNKYTAEEWVANPCVTHSYDYGAAALSQALLADTAFYRDGTPLVPPQPNPLVWWQETGASWITADDTEMDQAVWLSYVQNYNLRASDTVYVWTVLSTVRDGTLDDLSAQIDYARQWYRATLLDLPPVCDSCLASGDINHSGGDNPTCSDFSIGDLSLLIDYLAISGGYVDYAADVEVDCMVDGEDLQKLLQRVPPYCPIPSCCTEPFERTCCDPLLIFSPATARREGMSQVSYASGTATVTNVGTTGEDGLRFYPNMDDAWRAQIHLALENVDLSQTGRKAWIDFTQVSGNKDMEWVAGIDAVNDGATVTLTTGLAIPISSTISLTASQGGSDEYVGEIVGNDLVFAAVAPTDPLVITEAALAFDDHIRMMVSFEQPVSFSVAGQSPEVAFTADRIVLEAASPYSAFVGLGPLVMTGAGMETFTLTADYPCCVGKVGDANGSGEDMPTIGDITTIVDALFIGGSCTVIPCLAEADANISGGCSPACGDITVGDISMLIDCLFVTGEPPFVRNECACSW